ncbi:MAG: TIGR03986 family type III CRISPR-associated RAMP protein [Tannerellaceae bacterium]
MIKAPFNFIPLSDKVFFPDWAHKISLDAPFKDGLSGSIKLTIKAESPIFVRNGHLDKDDSRYKDFCNIDGHYFIPATTLKGMTRSILSVLSYGKIRLDNNTKFAQREWKNDELYTLKKEQLKLSCGWLKRINNRYYILNCGRPLRIGQKEIDAYTRSNILESNFSQAKGRDLNKTVKLNGNDYDPKTAAYKYALLDSIPLTNLRFETDQNSESRVKVSNTGDINGDIVLTGQPSKWTYPRPKKLDPKAGKYYEFVFRKTSIADENLIEITEEVFKQYKSIYNKNADWERAYKHIDKQGIPVFFRKAKSGIKDFGLAFLYKLPYEKTPYETLPADHRRSNALDLVDCIFGQTTSNNEQALKGRVHFGHAFATHAECDQELSLILGSPKASYYPIYIQQDGNKGLTTKYNTYNNGTISGRKQYLRREETWQKSMNNEELDTKMIPLKKGATFECKIRFHNLLPIELGALLSALTFHKNTKKCHHLIGQAKPYGFGKVTIAAQLNASTITATEVELMAKFEECMNKELGRKWITTTSIQELFNIAHFNISNINQFTYMELDVENGNNEFVTAKENKEYLELYSSSTKDNYQPQSLLAAYQEAKEAEETRKANALKVLKEQEEREAKARAVELQAQNKELRINNGLAFLMEKNLHDQYKVSDFKGAHSRIDKWLKDSNNHSIPETEFEILIQALTRLKSNAAKKELKEWENPESRIWKKITEWTNKTITIDTIE